MHQFGMKNDQMKTQESSIKPKHSEAPKVTETHYDQPAFSQVYKQNLFYLFIKQADAYDIIKHCRHLCKVCKVNVHIK